MMLIFPRREPAGLDKYYSGDFSSRKTDPRPVMWVDELDDQVLKSPFEQAEVEGGEAGTSSSIVWKGMKKDEFNEIFQEVSPPFTAQNFKRRLFAIGTIFSPPKSISLAALAGRRVDRVIIEAHRLAVSFVADLMKRLLVTRR